MLSEIFSFTNLYYMKKASNFLLKILLFQIFCFTKKSDVKQIFFMIIMTQTHIALNDFDRNNQKSNKLRGGGHEITHPRAKTTPKQCLLNIK